MSADLVDLTPDSDVMPLVCDLGVRAVRALRSAGVLPEDQRAVTPAQIARADEASLLGLPNVGRSTVRGLRAILQRAGLDFASRPDPAARPPLSPRQRDVYAFVVQHVRERGYAPTLREMAAAMGIHGLNGVHDHVRAIVRKGWLRHDPEKARGLALVEGPAAEQRCVIALDSDTAARCTALLHELLDGPLGDDLVLDEEHDRDLRALLGALDARLRNSTISHAADAAHGGT